MFVCCCLSQVDFSRHQHSTANAEHNAVIAVPSVPVTILISQFKMSEIKLIVKNGHQNMFVKLVMPSVILWL